MRLQPALVLARRPGYKPAWVRLAGMRCVTDLQNKLKVF